MDDRLVADLVRLRPLIDPPKKSPIEEPGLVLNRLREIASRPKIAAFERAVGVPGSELLPVLNSNKPNWWTTKLNVMGQSFEQLSRTRLNNS